MLRWHILLLVAGFAVTACENGCYILSSLSGAALHSSAVHNWLRAARRIVIPAAPLHRAVPCAASFKTAQQHRATIFGCL